MKPIIWRASIVYTAQGLIPFFISDRKCRKSSYNNGQLCVAESFTNRFVRASFNSVKILKHMRRLHGNKFEVYPKPKLCSSIYLTSSTLETIS